MPAWFYILRLKSGALYTGATTDLERRCEDHRKGTACRTTRLDPPVALIYSEQFPAFADARNREAQVKRWSRSKKEAFARGNTTTLHRLAKSREHGGQGRI